MKKIMFYISTLSFGGAERVMTVLANSLSADKEYEVIFVTTYIKEKEYSLNHKIRRYILDRHKLDRNFVSKNIRYIYSLRRIIKKERPNILISFMAEPNFRAVLANAFLKTKVIISVRNDPYKEYPNNFLFSLAQILFQFADGCVFQTEDAKKCFNKRVQNKSWIILNPVSECFFKVDRDENAKDIVSIGRLEKQKNFELLINAYSAIANECPNDNLLIYGQGSRKHSLEELIIKLGMEERIFLMGVTERVEEVFKHAKLFVMSSDFEGLPNALMEAIAAGVPVVSTNCPCGGPRMLIKNGVNGYLVPVGDEQKMIIALNRVLRRKEIAEQFTNNNLEIRESYRENHIVDKWINYFNVVEKRK